MTTTALYGAQAEAIAAAYLARKEFIILAQNARFGRYEIDIIAYDTIQKMIVFVEVKARRRSTAAYPIRLAVNHRKRRALRQAIDRWTIENEYDGPGRLDIVCIASSRVAEHIVDSGADFF